MTHGRTGYSPLTESQTAQWTGTVVARVGHMPDVRFQSLGDEDLADIWYALSACANRHPDRFKALTDAVLDALLARQGDGLKWLEQRFRAIRLTDSKESVRANARVS